MALVMSHWFQLVSTSEFLIVSLLIIANQIFLFWHPGLGQSLFFLCLYRASKRSTGVMLMVYLQGKLIGVDLQGWRMLVGWGGGETAILQILRVICVVVGLFEDHIIFILIFILAFLRLFLARFALVRLEGLLGLVVVCLFMGFGGDAPRDGARWVGRYLLDGSCTSHIILLLKQRCVTYQRDAIDSIGV